MKKRAVVFAFVFVIFSITFVGGYVSIKEDVGDNLIEMYRGNLKIDLGILSISNEDLPFELSRGNVWKREDGFITRIDPVDFRVEERLEMKIDGKDAVIGSVKEFLKKYDNILGIDVSQLEVIDVYTSPEFFMSSGSSASPTPTPSPRVTPTPPTSSTSKDIHPNQMMGAVFLKQFIVDADGKKRYVVGSFVNIVLKEGDDNVKRLVSYKANTYEDAALAENKLLFSKDEAIQGIIQYLSNLNPSYSALKARDVEEIAFPVRGEKGKDVIMPAMKISFEKIKVKEKYFGYDVFVGFDGRIVYIYDRLRHEQVFGQITGSFYSEIPSNGQIDNVGFQNEEVVIIGESGEKVSVTDDLGKYNLEITNPTMIKSGLNGPRVKVIDVEQGRGMEIERSIASGYDINWKDYDPSYKQEQSNVFYYTNLMYDFAIQPNINPNGMDFQMPVFVNYASSCNAFYDSLDKSINFFRNNDECEATSLYSDVIYHEYGHAITDDFILLEYAFPYIDETGNLNEGISDYVACTVSDQQSVEYPECMDDFKLGNENTCFRRCDSDDTYPEDYGIEPHEGMQIISGALWDLREKIIEKIGKEEGIKKADSLVYAGLRFQPLSFADYVDGIILADDDNGNLEDGSPNIEEICNSFIERGIQSGYCAGMSEFPTVILSYPFNNFIIDKDRIDIIGSVWPGKGASIDKWELYLIGSELGESNRRLIKSSNIPVKRGILLDDFDISNLELGKQYLLGLLVLADGTEYKTQIWFTRSHIVNLKFINDGSFPQGYRYLGVYERGEIENPQRVGQSFYCFPSKLECEIYFFPSYDNSDILVFEDEKQFLGNKRVKAKYYFLFKNYNYPMETINFYTKDANAVRSNINDILTKEELELTDIVYYNYYLLQPPLIFYDYGKIESLAFYAFGGDDLLYKDYVLNLAFHASNPEKKKFGVINGPSYYPFKEDIVIDSAELRNFGIFVHGSFLLDNYHILIGEIIIRNNIDLSSMGVNDVAIWRTYPLLINERYNFLYNPIEGAKIIQVFNVLGRNEIDENSISKKVYNGEGTNLEDSPSELLENVEFFKEPFSLKVEVNDFGIKGYLVDDYSKSHILSEKGGEVALTYPFGDRETIELSNGEWGWSPRCPSIVVDGEKRIKCPRAFIGEYKIDWVFADVFRDGRVLELHEKFYYDGKRFSRGFIRGDANNDGKVDLSDAIFVLNYLFKAGKSPFCLDAADANDDGLIDISDAVKILIGLFRGDPIPAPYPDIGFDSTEDNLASKC